MKKFTVKRSRWVRGGKNGDPALLNNEGCMCCLGFAAHQISRKTKKNLLEASMPSEVFRGTSFLTECEYGNVFDNALAEKAQHVNDDTHLSEKMRENALKALFRKHKIDIKFVD